MVIVRPHSIPGRAFCLHNGRHICGCCKLSNQERGWQGLENRNCIRGESTRWGEGRFSTVAFAAVNRCKLLMVNCGGEGRNRTTSPAIRLSPRFKLHGD